MALRFRRQQQTGNHIHRNQISKEDLSVQGVGMLSKSAISRPMQISYNGKEYWRNEPPEVSDVDK